MKKNLLIILFTLLIGTVVFYACKKSETKVKTEKQTISKIQQINMIKKHFHIIDIADHDFNNNTKFKNAVAQNGSMISRTVESLQEELDYRNVTSYAFEDGTTAYLIPFLADPLEVLSVLGSSYDTLSTVDRMAIVRNHVDTTENYSGTIMVTQYNVSFSKTYLNGILTDSSESEQVTPELTDMSTFSKVRLCQRNKKETFRSCFDRMEDTICDGFWGCIAWNTNPQVPILAALVCTCYK